MVLKKVQLFRIRMDGMFLVAAEDMRAAVALWKAQLAKNPADEPLFVERMGEVVLYQESLRDV